MSRAALWRDAHLKQSQAEPWLYQLTCSAAFCCAAMCCCSAWSRKSLFRGDLVSAMLQERIRWYDTDHSQNMLLPFWPWIPWLPELSFHSRLDNCQLLFGITICKYKRKKGGWSDHSCIIWTIINNSCQTKPEVYCGFCSWVESHWSQWNHWGCSVRQCKESLKQFCAFTTTQSPSDCSKQLW